MTAALVGRRADRLEGSAVRVGVVRYERVLDPPGGVVDKDVDRSELVVGGVEQPCRALVVLQVGLHGDRCAAASADVGDDVVSVPSAVAPIRVGHRGIGRVVQRPVRAHDGTALSRQRSCGRRPDSVIGPGHDCDMISCRLLHH